VPPPPATLPDGTLDCDPEIATFPALSERQAEQIARTIRLINTPPDVLRAERLRREELDHARALSQARIEGHTLGRRRTTQRRPGSRLERFRVIITRAAHEAGENYPNFCAFLDRDDVPADPKWRVSSWVEAWENKGLRSSIRGIKYRYGSPS
jgi:hypothetical protein